MIGHTLRESLLFSHGSWGNIIHPQEKEESLADKLEAPLIALHSTRSDRNSTVPLDLKTYWYKNLWNSDASCPQTITLSLEMRGQPVQWEQLLHFPHLTIEHVALTFPPLFTLHSSLKAPHRGYLILTFSLWIIWDTSRQLGAVIVCFYFGVLKYGCQQICTRPYRQNKF